MKRAFFEEQDVHALVLVFPLVLLVSTIRRLAAILAFCKSSGVSFAASPDSILACCPPAESVNVDSVVPVLVVCELERGAALILLDMLGSLTVPPVSALLSWLSEIDLQYNM